MIVHKGENSFFEKSKLPDDSIDLLFFTDLFGTPMLIGNDSQSLQIVSELGRVLKSNGHLIVSDQMFSDADITQKRLDYLRKKGFIFKQEEARTKGGTPWIGYQLQKK